MKLSERQGLHRSPSKPPGCAVACFLVVALMVGCREHPRVTSRESLDLIKQVYTACNTRSASRLSVCQLKLKELTDQGLIGVAEQKSFQRIFDTAQQGDWSEAQSASLQFARDQVR